MVSDRAFKFNWAPLRNGRRPRRLHHRQTGAVARHAGADEYPIQGVGGKLQLQTGEIAHVIEGDDLRGTLHQTCGSRWNLGMGWGGRSCEPCVYAIYHPASALALFFPFFSSSLVRSIVWGAVIQTRRQNINNASQCVYVVHVPVKRALGTATCRLLNGFAATRDSAQRGGRGRREGGMIGG